MKYQFSKQEQCLPTLKMSVYTLKELMPTQYQKDNLDAMLGLFLEAQGHPLPQHSQTKLQACIESVFKCQSLVNKGYDSYCSQPCSRDGFKGFISIYAKDADHFYRSSLT